MNKYTTVDENGNPDKPIKLSPNPNVLLELGYAAGIVGWENVICILNTDYGSEKELPFDIAQRRLTPYSLKTTEKSDVRKYLRGIIAETVMNLIENGKRVRPSFANLIIGSYDLSTKEISKALIPWKPGKSPVYLEEREETLRKCLELLSKIQVVRLTNPEQKAEATVASEEVKKEIVLPNGDRFKPLVSNDFLSKFVNKPQSVKVNDKDRQSASKLIKKYLGVDVEPCIFNLGNLTRKIVGQSEELIGTDEEQAKYYDIIELEYLLHHIQMLECYLETFSGLYLFPLAIRNISIIPDKDITVNLKVDMENAEIVIPGATLINSDMSGLQGLVYEDDNLKKLLMMQNNADIQYGTDISYDIRDIQAQVRHINVFGQQHTPRYNEKDYEREIQKYIASPNEGSTSEVAYNIQSLRPKETNWLGAAILLKPMKDTVLISYSIISQRSNGELSGTLEYHIE